MFDLNSEIDSSLSYFENERIILEKIKPLVKDKEQIIKKEILGKSEEYKSQIQNFSAKYFDDFNILKKKHLEKIKTIAIYGDVGTGKTALAYKIISLFEKEKQVYFLKHPKPYVIAAKGYKNLNNINELQNLQDCIVYLDEPQLHISIYDKHSNKIFSKICSLARQRNILLIISSSDTRVFTKWNESFFDLWLIKDLDYSMVKNGSKIKRAYKENAILDASGLKLNENQFISDSRILSNFNGIHTFSLIDGWNDELSKPYRI